MTKSKTQYKQIVYKGQPNKNENSEMSTGLPTGGTTRPPEELVGRFSLMNVMAIKMTKNHTLIPLLPTDGVQLQSRY